MKRADATPGFATAACLVLILAAGPACLEGGGGDTVSDIDGNTYTTVAVGGLTWMGENLRTTRFDDGTPIADVTDDAQWLDRSSAASCAHGNDPGNVALYGRLYNGHAAASANLCPAGWRVPTDDDWTDLVDSLGGDPVAGGRMKATGTDLWNPPNAGATDEAGFGALPGGGRGQFFVDASFGGVGTGGYWWSSTPADADRAWIRFVTHADTGVARTPTLLSGGFSVRCVTGP